MRISTASHILVMGLLLVTIVTTSLGLVSLSKTNDIQGVWAEFESNKNVRLDALIALRRELGYGGMIHKFKNYILRHNQDDANKFIASVGGARAALNRYRSLQLSATEKRMLLAIENKLDEYSTAFTLANTLIAEKKNIRDIDRVIKVDDAPAITALMQLELEAGITTKEGSENTQSVLLSRLRTLMGYGGFIHHFKNQILRNGPLSYELADEEAEKVHSLIQQYRQKSLSDIEKRSLQKIGDTVQKYQNNLAVIKQLRAEGKTIEEIDAAVIVDDTSAIEGLADLHRELIRKNEEQGERLSNSLNILKLSERLSFIISATFLSFLLVLSIWLLYHQVNRPLSVLNRAIKRLSNNQFNVEIEGLPSNNEMGELAGSLELLKENVAKKDSAEKHLQLAKSGLEERVVERTKELKANERRLESLVENAVDAIITISERGIIQSFNSAAMLMFGYRAHEVVGHNVNILMPEPYKSHHDGYLSHYLATGKKKIIGIGREVEGKHKNGDVFPMELAISEIDVEGERLFTGIIRDVSDKKAKDKELKDKVGEAEKANEAKSEFLSSMSHELRTPMNSILGFTQLLASDTKHPLSEEQQSSLAYIQDSGLHLLKLVDDILDLTKIESGSYEVPIEEVNLNELVNYVATLIKPEAESASIQLVNKISDRNQYTVRANELKLKQVILNLASNAIKYNSDQGSVTFSCSQPNKGKIRLNVTDMGEGIPKGDFPALFEPFNRLKHANSSILGTGIGLTITKELVEIMEGELGVFNNPEKGATFWVEFEQI